MDIEEIRKLAESAIHGEFIGAVPPTEILIILDCLTAAENAAKEVSDKYLSLSIKYFKIVDDHINMSIDRDQLRTQIEKHNKMCIDLCANKTNCGFSLYERDCGNCIKDFMIDSQLILPPLKDE